MVLNLARPIESTTDVLLRELPRMLTPELKALAMGLDGAMAARQAAAAGSAQPPVAPHHMRAAMHR